jgi:hypothetical protein
VLLPHRFILAANLSNYSRHENFSTTQNKNKGIVT